MPAVATHASPYSGQWYPGDSAALARLIDTSIQESVKRTGDPPVGRPVGLVVPHAGIAYSGTVAAAAYRHLQSRPPERVFLLGFPHRGCEPGIRLPDLSAFETPLGTTRVDREAMALLSECEAFCVTEERRLCDHSVEIQLPFLARCAPESLLVPIYVCRPGVELRLAAAKRIAEIMRPGDVIVASSDFTHYGRAFDFQPFPVNSSTGERLRSLDSTVIEAAGSLDEEIFLEALRDSEATVCGFEPISLLLAALARLEDSDEIFQQQLDYQTSGEITGDFHHSVSYAALGYFRQSALALSGDEQALLLDCARKTLDNYQRTGRRDRVPPERITPALARRTGVFVSLHKGGELRGCVGRVKADEPIASLVPEMTLAAATEDNRFRPVKYGETGIDIEISVLSPMKRVSSSEKIHAGKHGVYVDTGWRRGLLLPQVAADRGWDTGQFLNALAAKIGARREDFDAPDARLYRFQAQVFH